MGKDCHRVDGHRGDGGGAISSSKSKRKATVANGCMSAFYHLFDFQHFYFHSHHQLTIDSPSRSKGFKLEESPTNKEKQSLNIPVSMRVRTETGTTSSRPRVLATEPTTSSSEICNSPSSNTPNLVARLMGLDLLPDKTDLNHSLTNLHTMTHYGSNLITSHRLSKKGTHLGTRSLPESPRISSARKSDFDIHRLSLQLNKENKHEVFGCSRPKVMKQDQEETLSPRDYARQIVKQIKERVVVTRRVVGMDITNPVKNREARPALNSNELRRDSTVSCSPRTRFSDKENPVKDHHSTSSFRQEQITQKQKPKPKPKPTTVILVSVSKASGEKQSQKRVRQRQLKPINQCKKAENETKHTIKPSPNPNIRIKQREAFLSESTEAKVNHLSNPLHKKRFKKITKSNVLDNISATRPSQKQINERAQVKSDASICFSLIHKTEKNSPQVARNHKLDDTATVSASYEGMGIDSEEEYIARTMNLAGINTDSLVSSSTKFSPLHPLDPLIFNKLEQSGENPSGSLALRCNRRLLFDLLNEILIKTMEIQAKRRRNYHGSQLISELCSAVARYSRKRCSVREETASMDVDHLLETRKLEEEGEEIVAEIERDIVDALVRETAYELSINTRRMKTMTFNDS